MKYSACVRCAFGLMCLTAYRVRIEYCPTCRAATVAFINARPSYKPWIRFVRYPYWSACPKAVALAHLDNHASWLEGQHFLEIDPWPGP
jgi:hypothetical protein